MPYIAFDLDAMARAENVARARGMADTVVKGGLLNLWAHCFRETTDDVTRTQIRAFFGHDLAEDLEAFGFLETRAEAYRVRGADRYLRLKKAYAAGAAKTNALRRRPKAPDSDAIATPYPRPETPLHRAPSSEQREKLTTLSTSSTDEGPPASVAVVFEHWRQVMKSPKSKLDAKRRRLIGARLKEFSVEDLKRSIEGCSKDAFSMGQNDRGSKFNSIDLICRDAEHVEKFLQKSAPRLRTVEPGKDPYAVAT